MGNHNKSCLVKFTLLLILLLCLQLVVFGQTGGTTQYVYDNNGRLVAVIAPNGETALYQYDFAGNLIGITRQNNPITVISSFTPASGVVGATVTIRGVGFGSPASQNTVTFNGTIATISSASETEIITTVPIGATDGPIRVTGPNGTAVSRTNFNVVPPTNIFNLNPTLGDVSSELTILGEGFSDVVSGNNVFFNGMSNPAVNYSASDQVLVSEVPIGATSGRITVSSPNGTAVSAQDFFVPPPGYSTSRVEVTGRININETRNVSILSNGNIAILVFDGTAGTTVSLGSTSIPTSSGEFWLNKPDGTTLSNGFISPSQFFVENILLPVSGTYSVIIRSSRPEGLLMNVRIFLPDPDVQGSINIDGPPLTIGNEMVGQNIGVRFNGTPGQRTFIKLSSNGVFATVSIFNPDGTPITENHLLSLGSQTAIDIHNLTQNGSFLIRVDPYNIGVGNITVQAFSTANIAIDGGEIPVVFTVPDQTAVFNFSGIGGESINVNFSGGGDTFTRLASQKGKHYAGISPTIKRNTKGPWIDDSYDYAALLPDPDTISVYQPDGTLLVSVPFNQSIANQPLPITGTYRLEVTPPSGFTGTFRLRLGPGGGGGS